MIPVAWLAGIGLAAVIGGGAYYAFKHWDEIKAWVANTIFPAVSKVIRMLGERLGPQTKFATDLIAQKLDEYTASINHELYYQENGEWWVEKTKAKLPNNQLPARVQGRIRTVGSETSIANQYDMGELGLAV